MTTSAVPSAVFDTTLTAIRNNTGIVVPDDAITALGSGKRPSVLVKVNGYEYQNTVGVMGGRCMISVSAAIRRATGLSGGDPIHVELTLAEGPREVKLPTDFAEALAAEPRAGSFFAGLSNSLQRYHIDNINAAKTAETRERRIEKAIALLRDGKPR